MTRRFKNDVQLTEGNSDTKPFTFNISLSAASDFPVTVQYTTSPDSAQAGEGYITTAGTLTFNPGDPLTQTITVPVIGDTIAFTGESWTKSLLVLYPSGFWSRWRLRLV